MTKGATKRSSNAGSPVASSAAKKQKLERKKVAPQPIKKTQKSADPIVKSFCEKLANPEDAIQLLLANAKMPIDEFFTKHWEKLPLAMHADEENKEFSSIFGFDYFCKLLKDNDTDSGLEFAPEKDFVFSRFVDNKKEVLDVEDNLTEEVFKKHFNDDKYSVQINQPQRFQDAFWALLEKLESYFGSVVGAKAYISPEKCQMLAPHYDEVEKFIVQLEGQKTWTLYKPKMELPVDFSPDLEASEIGEPTMTVTLKAGDILYLPRGTIHQAKAETRSAHITLYTYQMHNMITHLQHTLPAVMNQQTTKCVELRRGLPIGFLPGAKSLTADQYADVLVKMAESIRTEKESIPIAEEMVSEFMSMRLPPFGLEEFDPEANPAPKAADKISLRNKQHITWFVKKSEDFGGDEMADEEEEEAEEENSPDEDLTVDQDIVVLTSIGNGRMRHMMVESRVIESVAESFVISVDYKPLLDKLMESEEPVEIKSLTGKSKKGTDLDTMMLVRGLFNIGALTIH